MRAKKILTLLLSTVMLFTIGTTAYAADIDEYEIAKDYLLNIGTPEEYLAILENQQILSMYNDLNGTDVTFGGYKSEIVYVREDGSASDIKPRGNIPTSKLQLTIGTYDAIANGTVKSVIVSLGYKWLECPILLLTDGMTFNWDGSLFNLNGFYAESGYTYTNGNFYQTDYVDAPATSANGGIGWFLETHFPIGGGTTSWNYGGASLRLMPRSTISSSAYLASGMHFNYAHQIVGGGISFGISGSGLSAGVSLSGGSYDNLAAYYTYR